MPLDVFRRLIAPLREPIVTSRYPDVEPVLPPAARGLPAVDPARCSRERSCVVACPTGAIEVGVDEWSVDAGRCVFCGICASACGPGAISLAHGITPVARERGHLVDRVRMEPRS